MSHTQPQRIVSDFIGKLNQLLGFDKFTTNVQELTREEIDHECKRMVAAMPSLTSVRMEEYKPKGKPIHYFIVFERKGYELPMHCEGDNSPAVALQYAVDTFQYNKLGSYTLSFAPPTIREARKYSLLDPEDVIKQRETRNEMEQRSDRLLAYWRGEINKVLGGMIGAEGRAVFVEMLCSELISQFRQNQDINSGMLDITEKTALLIADDVLQLALQAIEQIENSLNEADREAAELYPGITPLLTHEEPQNIGIGNLGINWEQSPPVVLPPAHQLGHVPIVVTPMQPQNDPNMLRPRRRVVLLHYFQGDLGEAINSPKMAEALFLSYGDKGPNLGKLVHKTVNDWSDEGKIKNTAASQVVNGLIVDLKYIKQYLTERQQEKVDSCIDALESKRKKKRE